MKILLLACLLAQSVFGQEKAAFHTWVDAFGSNQGAILYPQYSWELKTSGGNINGYGFVESTPHERAFSNHLVWYTPPKMAWFSAHTETGGFPWHNLGFFQVGPRFHLTKIVPYLGKPMARMSVVVLPRFIGIRPNNLLINGATNVVKLKGFDIWAESYYRFFPKGHPYGETWVLSRPERSRIAFGILIHNPGNGNNYVGFGIRTNFF